LPRYKVVGTQSVLNHQPGETFTATFEGDQESFLRQIGAIREVAPESSKGDKKRADRA
jgi:hypothetical protein